MRVIVCGGRNYAWIPPKATQEQKERSAAERSLIFQKLDTMGITELCHGGAPGADLAAEAWAKSRQINYRGYPAKWKKFKLAAGSKRNTEMLDEFGRFEKIDKVVAFPGGHGTANMVEQSLARDIEVEHGKA